MPQVRFGEPGAPVPIPSDLAMTQIPQGRLKVSKDTSPGFPHAGSLAPAALLNRLLQTTQR